MTSLVSLLFSMILKLLNFLYTCLFTFFCNIIMSGEPMYTASKERMVSEVMFLTECAPQSGCYALLSAMFGL